VGTADDTGVELLVDGSLRRVEYAAVARAAVEVEFRQPPAAELLMLENSGRRTKQDPLAGSSVKKTAKEESR
jgi:ribosome maturation factor RimP